MGTSLQSFLVSIPIAIILWALMLLAVAVAVVLMAEPRASAAAAARSRAARFRTARFRAARSDGARSRDAGSRGARAGDGGSRGARAGDGGSRAARAGRLAGEPNTGVPSLAHRVAAVSRADHLPAGKRAAGAVSTDVRPADDSSPNGVGADDLLVRGFSAEKLAARGSGAQTLAAGRRAVSDHPAPDLAGGDLAGDDLAADDLAAGDLTGDAIGDLTGDAAGNLAGDSVEDELRFAGEVSVAAERAASTAARCRAEWEAAQDELDLAWAAYEEADVVARRTWAATAYPLMSRRRKLGENADRERYLHHAAAEACRRRELSIAQLNDVYAHRGWNPRLHPVVQEALLHNAIRENRFAAYQAAQRRERAAWQRSEIAAEALRALRAEAAAAFGRAAVEEPVAGEFWWAEPWTTSELPVAA